MAKHTILLKKIIKEGLVAASIAGVLGGAMLGANALLSSTVTKEQTLSAELMSSRDQTTKLKQTIEDLGEAAQIFFDLSSSGKNMDIFIDRDQLRDLLAVLRKRHNLTTLKVSVNPSEKFAHPDLDLIKLEAIKVRATLTIGGMSDQILVNFARDIQRDLPGYVDIAVFKINRASEIDINTLSRISQGTPVEVVNGELVFFWYGFSKKGAKKDTEVQNTP